MTDACRKINKADLDIAEEALDEKKET